MPDTAAIERYSIVCHKKKMNVSSVVVVGNTAPLAPAPARAPGAAGKDCRQRLGRRSISSIVGKTAQGREPVVAVWAATKIGHSSEVANPRNHHNKRPENNAKQRVCLSFYLIDISCITCTPPLSYTIVHSSDVHATGRAVAGSQYWASFNRIRNDHSSHEQQLGEVGKGAYGRYRQGVAKRESCARVHAQPPGNFAANLFGRDSFLHMSPCALNVRERNSAPPTISCTNTNPNSQVQQPIDRPLSLAAPRPAPNGVTLERARSPKK